MPLSMYQASVPVFVTMLTNLSGILDKAAAHASARKIDPAALLTMRLYPDMFAFTRQVQLASDFAKGATARLAGQDPPKFEDNEASFDQLKARIQKTLDFVKSVPASAIDGSETRTINVPMRERTITPNGQDYLLRMVLPNFFFHVTTAYDILRHAGVEVGKRDFVGPMPG
jgi:hypothetical protein